MSQINANYVIDVAILSAVSTVLIRLVYLRFNRESYTQARKYKPGTVEYRNTMKVTSTPVLAIMGVVLLATLLRVGFDARAIIQSHDPDRYWVLVWLTLGVVLLYGLIAYVLSGLLGFPLASRRNKHKSKDSWPV